MPSTSQIASEIPRFVLTLQCPDRSGIVHGVTEALLAAEANILENDQFREVVSGAFCMRTRFETPLADADTVRMHLELVARHGIPFVHLPIAPATKLAQEARLSELVDQHQIDLIVLTRYMQILSADLCDRFSERVINIHHSFLPGFKGAKPYHQAFERQVLAWAVKLHAEDRLIRIGNRVVVFD